jgi:hypothetical protein
MRIRNSLLIILLLFWTSLLHAQTITPQIGGGIAKGFDGGISVRATAVNTACAQGTAYVAALTAPTPTEQAAYKLAICSMVTHGTFQLLDALYIHANTSSANARVNAVNPGTYNLTAHGSCTFTADQGFTGDGSTCYLDPGFIPSTAGGHMKLNSATFGVCALNSRTVGAAVTAYGGSDGTNLSYAELLNSSQIEGALNDATGEAATSSNAQGAWAQVRTATNTVVFYLNGAALSTTVNGSSTALIGADIFELAFNNNGTTANYVSDQQGYWFYGASLTAGQVASLYNDLGLMMGTLGNIPCAVSAPAPASSYFAAAGSDSNPCSMASPCKSIAKANFQTYTAGSNIYFNKGDTFNGCISITPSNATPTALNPLTITSYGTGAAPIINTTCSSGFTAGLTLDTITGVVVNGLNFVQGGNSPATYAGILIINTAGSVASGNYTIENNSFSGGFTSQGGSAGTSGGDIIIRGFTGGCADISNVSILNNTMSGTSGVTSLDQNGILTSDGCSNTLGGNMQNWTAQGNLCSDLGGTNPNTGTNPGNCIGIFDSTVVLDQFNLAHDLGWNCTVTPGCGVGFWSDATDQAVIQFSEAYNIQPGFSTTGTDFDCVDHDEGTTNSVIQYVFCHHNYGYGVTGVVETIGSVTTWGPNTVRYMITENDNARTGDLTAGQIAFFNANSGASPGTVYIYNNTIWNDATTSPTRTPGYGNQSGWPGGVFQNNIIAMTQDSDGTETPVSCGGFMAGNATTITQTFTNNDYYPLNGGTVQFYLCGPGATNITFAVWAAAIAGGESGTIQTAPGFAGSPPDAACTWTPSTIMTWPPSGCAADVQLAAGAQNAKSAGNALSSASGWPGAAPTKDFYQNTVPGTGSCWNIGAYGVCP